MTTINMLEHDVPALRDMLSEAGHQAYRAKQLAGWVYNKGVVEFDMMSNIPASLGEIVQVMNSKVIERLDSKDGTMKLLIELCDGQAVETVLIPSKTSSTACVSTQVGCAMGCTFCASAIGGFQRNCKAHEILQQLLHLWRESTTRPTNVVFMGTGEPMLNLSACAEAIRAITDPERFNISARHVTVSTVGIPQGIRRLARLGIPVTLAISLHAPNDAIRRQIMPVASKYSLDEIMDCARAFYASRHREITLEYLLLGGLNDTNVCAEGLAKIAHTLRSNVNLIVYNPVQELDFHAPTPADVKRFLNRLRSRGVNVHVRASRGQDTQAACGQLRLRHA